MNGKKNTHPIKDEIRVTVRGWYAVNNRLSEIEAEAPSKPHELNVIRGEILSGRLVWNGKLEIKVRYAFESSRDEVAFQLFANSEA